MQETQLAFLQTASSQLQDNLMRTRMVPFDQHVPRLSRLVRQQAMEQRFLGLPMTAAEESRMAAGFLAGLKAGLGLCDAESSLVAYVYTLMRGERKGAAKSARQLLDAVPGETFSCSGYLDGLEAARNALGDIH